MYIKKFEAFNESKVNEGYVDRELTAEIKAATTVKEVEDLVAEHGIGKGDLMKIAYDGNTSGVDTAIPMDYWKKLNTSMFVMDYQNQSFGKLVNLAEKIVGEETNWEEKYQD